MRKKSIELLGQNRKKGISMVIVLCVSAFFIALAAAIIYMAGVLTAGSGKRLLEERCYQLSKSYAELLDKELLRYQNKKSTDAAPIGKTFYYFANQFLDESRYLEYSEDYPDATSYSFAPYGTDMNNPAQSTVAEGYGNISITLRKELNTDETNPGEGTIPAGSGSYTQRIEALQNTSIRKYILSVAVTAWLEDISYTYTTEYTREEKYNVEFTYDGQTIVWVATESGGDWHIGNSAGTVVTPTDEIHYRYVESDTTESRFVENLTKTDDSQTQDTDP